MLQKKTSPLKILEISGDTGSTEVIARNLAKVWKSEGHEVEVYAPVKSRFDFKAINYLYKNRKNFDLIHAHLGRACMLAGQMGKALDIPTIATLHGFQKAKHYRYISNFTAVSAAVKKHFVAQGVPSENIQIIHNGFDPSIRTENSAYRIGHLDKNEIGLKNVIGTVGTLTQIKNQKLLIEAMPRVIESFPETILLIAGEGELRCELQKQIKKLNLEKHVYLLGHINIENFYHQIDLYAQASIREGFCMPLLEAMACGVPVITTPCAGPEEFITNGKDGIILDEISPTVMSDKIIRLLENKELREKLGQQAYKNSERLTWERQAALYEKVIRKAIR